jgi:hypothetical protein
MTVRRGVSGGTSSCAPGAGGEGCGAHAGESGRVVGVGSVHGGAGAAGKTEPQPWLRLSVQVALGDGRRAIRLGETLDITGLPTVLRGRRSHVHLELAWASVQQKDDSLAVLHLLEAERVASQAVSRNVLARELLTTMLARERTSATPGLRALAGRAGLGR